jgi:hypothetical protein
MWGSAEALPSLPARHQIAEAAGTPNSGIPWAIAVSPAIMSRPASGGSRHA